MICSVCEGKNRDGARFCTYCGAPLALRCGVCDTALVPGARFCDACGTAVSEGDEPAPAARKVVTVLFGDLTGSTSMEESLDAEAVRSIIDRFYATMRAEIERYGGRVVKFTGDGVMAAFGVPEVREDDASRAIEAAIAMRAECEQLASDLDVALALKVGINTGEVVVSEADDDVVGDAVNVASRLEGAASANEIFVGEQTWRLTRGAARFEPLEPLTLKGKAEPVAAYRLLALDERTADSAAAPFVGRESEVRVLLDAFDQAVEAKASRVVTIIGSPGLGKTRLAREATTLLGEVARVREARCDPAGTATFAPIAEALRAAAEISESDTGTDIVAKLVARLPESDPERDRVAERAAAILGVGRPGTTEETFWAIRRLIEAAASERPVVLILDDLHWAEPLLLDLVEHLAEWITTAPVLLVGTGRPELRDTRPSLAEGGRAAAVIALEGLDGEATAKLALNLLGAAELPEELLAKIPDSTHGNPLFVRELVRMLVDDGVLLRTGDGWRVTVDVDAIQVPPTIQSLLSARVDRLRNDERIVLELASVVGKEFYRGALDELAPAGIRELVDGCLESLRRKELVEPTGTYWIDEPVFRFHHVLIRDAAYRRVLKETRAELHEHVAAWLEIKTLGVLGEHDELIGYHVEQAFEYKRQLGRVDENLGRRAAELLGGAARRALDRDDVPAAASLSGRALACLGADDPERPELLLVRCEALLSMGDVAHSEAAIDELHSVASTPRLRAWATCFSAQLSTVRSSDDLDEVGQRVATAADVFIDLGDEAGAAKAHIVRANILGSSGRIADGEMMLDAALTFARQAGDRRRIAETLGVAPNFALWGPSPVSRAGGRCLDIIRLLRITTGSPSVEATSIRCQALLEAYRGRADASRRMLDGVRRTLSELGIRHQSTDLFAGIVELIDGDPAAALQPLTTAYEDARSAGLDVLAAHSAAELARAHLRLGNDDESERFVEECSRLGGGDLTSSIAWRSVKAELLARRGGHAEAQRLAREAVALAEPTDYLFDHGQACRSLAAVLRAGGDAAGAREVDERAFALEERKGATAMLERDAPPTPVSAVATGSHASLDNTCVRRTREFHARLVRGDVDGALAFHDDDVVFDDRRRGVRSVTAGSVAITNSLEQLAGAIDEVKIDVLATRGERLALMPITWRVSGYEVDTLLLAQIDADGLFVHVVQFDPDDRDVAVAELDERFIASVECSAPDVVRAATRLVRAVSDQAWEEVRAVMTQGVAIIDNRPASLGPLDDREAWIASLIEIQRLMPLRARVVTYHEIRPEACVVEVLNASHVTGAAWETTFVAVLLVRAGRITRMEYFQVDEAGKARARLDELDRTHVSGALVQPTRNLTNAATRFIQRLREAHEAEDVSAFLELHSEAFVRDDRRLAIRHETRGLDEIQVYVEAAWEAGFGGFEHLETLAIRGDRLALSRRLYSGNGFEVELLIIDEVDEDGRVLNATVFDPSDLDAAFAELDERFAGGEGKRNAQQIRLGTAVFRAMNDRDWVSYRALLTDDLTLVDHRPTSLGEMTGAAAQVEAVQALANVMPNIQFRPVALHAIDERAALVHVSAQDRTSEGDLNELPFLAVYGLTPTAVSRIELFSVDALDEAQARFDQLTSLHAALENRSSDAHREILRRLLARDRDGVRRMNREDSAIFDRRRGLHDEVHGADEVLRFTDTMLEIGIRQAQGEVVALRGERLSLMRWIYRGDFEVEVLALMEVDDAGRPRSTWLYDADDLGTALEELDRLFVVGEGVQAANVIELAARLVRADSAQDWDALRSSVSDDVVLVDHRPASFGEVHGGDAFVELFKSLAESIQDRRILIASTRRLGSEVALCDIRVTGATDAGMAIDNSRLVLAQVVGDRFSRLEYFRPEQIDEAHARFDALNRVNDATSAAEAIEGALRTGDWAAIGSIVTDDVLVEDRRPGMGSDGVGRDVLVETLSVLRELGFRPSEGLTLRTIGDSLALRGGHVTDADGNEIHVLYLCETVDRRCAAVVFFDPADRASADAELERRSRI